MAHDFSVPTLSDDESYHGWWEAVKEVIGHHTSVGFLNPDDPEYEGWSTEDARLAYCGEKPEASFPDPMPEDSVPRRYNTRHEETDQETQERERFEWSMKLWKENKLAWEKARDRYLVKERFFKGELVAVEAIVVKSVSTMYKRYLKGQVGAQQKINALLKHARPDEVQLMHTLNKKYRDVLFAYPQSARPGHDSALDAWLSQWEEALGNLFDQGDAELDERKWLSEFALNFNSWWPRIASRVMDLHDKANIRRPQHVQSMISVLKIVKEVREFEAKSSEVKRKRIRGQTFATFEAAGSDTEEETEESSQPQNTQNAKNFKRVRQSGRAMKQDAPPVGIPTANCEACGNPSHKLEQCWNLFPRKSTGSVLITDTARMRAIDRITPHPDLWARYKKELELSKASSD